MADVGPVPGPVAVLLAWWGHAGAKELRCSRWAGSLSRALQSPVPGLVAAAPGC